jgi:hypothetical protein
MGWNDHFDPSEYDPSDNASMQALADRAIAKSRTTTTAATPPAEGDDVGECWDCGAEGVKLYRKGLCGRCKVADMY